MPSDGLWQYLVMSDVTMAMLGHVDTLSQLSNPIIVWS